MIIAASDIDLPVLLGNAAAIAYDGYAFRALPGSLVVHNLGFEHLWAGEAEGRCNPKGVLRLYLSLDRKTAEAEFGYYQMKAGLNADLADYYSFSVQIRLARVLDLRDAKTRRRLKISSDKILADWEPDPLLSPPPPITRLQAIGHGVSIGHGDFSGIICPSARRKSGSNLVLFKKRLCPGDLVKPLSGVPTKGWS